MVQLSYVIEFVGDMDRAVKFYRDVVGLPLKFQSPGWSEFSTLGIRPWPCTQPRKRTPLARLK